jgi:sporulation protein YlmC with PRC-barrel domain
MRINWTTCLATGRTIVVAATLATLPSSLVSAQELMPEAQPDALEPTLATLSAYSMLEFGVVTSDAVELGQVYDVIVDPVDGVLKFVVVMRDATVFGIDFPFVGTRAAVPWHQVQVQDSPRQFRLEMTLEEVEQLPEWEGERTEGAILSPAPVDERPDVPAQN